MNEKVTKGLKVVKDLFFVDTPAEADTGLPRTTSFNPVAAPSPGNSYDGHATAKLEPRAAPAPAPPLAKPPETVEEIYQQEKLQQPSYTAEKLLKTLDKFSDLSTVARRAVISDMLEEMNNVTPQSIAQDANRKRRVLQKYAENLSAQTDAFIGAKQQEVAKLEKQIAEARQAIEQEQARHTKIKELCLAHAERLEQVEAFLGQDVSS